MNSQKSQMPFFAIVLLSVAMAVAYGVVHDQITVRISLEYFTVGHPRVFETNSPTLLAMGWGVVATWWVGLPLGFLVASAARNGRRYEPLPVVCVASFMLRLVAVMGVSALLSAGVGWILATSGLVTLPDHLRQILPTSAQYRFVAAWYAHLASYFVGMVGGLVVAVLVWKKRTKHPAQAS